MLKGTCSTNEIDLSLMHLMCVWVFVCVGEGGLYVYRIRGSERARDGSNLMTSEVSVKANRT